MPADVKRECLPRREDIPTVMRAYVIGPDGGQLVDDHPVTRPKDGEALVKVLRAGICNTDLELMRGYKGGYTGVLGHEFVGVVVEADSEEELVGRRVCGELNISCYHCGICKRGGSIARNHCSKRTVLGIIGHDGTYAEYLTLPIVNLHRVPDGISTEAATFVEPLAAACRIVEQGLVKTEDRVCVLGDGKLGLLIAEVLGRQGLARKPMLLGRHAARAALLGDLVESRQLSRTEIDLPADLKEVFDVVVDVTGTDMGLDLATQLVMPMGTVVLKTTCAEPCKMNTSMYVVKEINIVGSRCGPFPDAIRLLESCNLDISKYVTAVFPLAEASKALDMVKDKTKGCLKVQLAVASSEMDAVGLRS